MMEILPVSQDIKNPDEAVLQVQNTYFNGFQIGLGNADISLLMLLNGQPTGALSMSYTTAKSLHVMMGEMIDKLEEITERKIMTTREVDEGIAKLGHQK